MYIPKLYRIIEEDESKMESISQKFVSIAKMEVRGVKQDFGLFIDQPCQSIVAFNVELGQEIHLPIISSEEQVSKDTSWQHMANEMTIRKDSIPVVFKWAAKLQEPTVILHGVSNLRLNGVSIDSCNQLFISYQVLNLAYEKELSLIYTTDKWKKKHSLNFEYAGARAVKLKNYAGVDDFVVQLDLTSMIGKVESTFANVIHLEFAVLYVVSGREFWDNNLNQNHLIRICKNKYTRF